MVCDYERMPLAGADLNKSFRIALAVTTDEAWVQASGGGGGLFGWRDNVNGGHLTLYARQSSGWAGFGQDPEGGFHYAIHASDTAGNVITTGSFGQPAFWAFYMEMGRTYYMVIEWDEDAARFIWTVDGQVLVDQDAKLGFGSHAQGNLCFGTGGGASGWKGEIRQFSGEEVDIPEGPVYRWNREHSINEYVECESRYVPLEGADLNKSFRIAHKVTTDESWTQTGSGGGGIFGWRGQGHLTLYARETGQGFHYALHASDVQGNVITTGSYGQPTFYVFYAARGQTYKMVVEWDAETEKLAWIVNGRVVVDREAPRGFGYHARGSLCYGTGGGAEAWIGRLEPMEYVYGTHEPNSCPVGYVAISAASECEAAAGDMGKGWYGARGSGARVCTYITNSPHARDNEKFYFGPIGTTDALSQAHHILVCRPAESESAGYRGCYKNQDQNRVDGHASDNTWNECQSAAVSAGKRFFGMEYPQGSSTPGRAQCLILDNEAQYSAMERMADSECEAEGLVGGKRLGSGHRLAVYAVSDTRRGLELDMLLAPAL